MILIGLVYLKYLITSGQWTRW